MMEIVKIKKIKTAIGLLFIAYWCYLIALHFSAIFLPNIVFKNSLILESSLKLKEELLNNISFLFEVLLDIFIFDHIFPLIIGIFILWVPISLISKTYNSFNETYKKAYENRLASKNSATNPVKTNNPSPRIGKVVVAIGVMLSIYGLLMDVSVEAGFGSRVINLSLISQRQNIFFFAGITILCGFALQLLTHRKLGEERTPQLNAESQEGMLKKCPMCAEEIKIEAVKCKFCHSDLSKINNSV